MAISICMASDKNYGVPLSVAVYSIVKNSDQKDELSFYILDGGIDDEIKTLIESYKNIKDFSVNYISMQDKFKGYATCYHISVASFYRILIPTTFPKLDKMLYLDVDIIVQSSLAPLWNEDITGYYVAAIPDPGPRFTLRDGNTYINAGILLMNLELWRKENVEKPLVEFLAERGDDQDAINTILQDKVKILSNKWNYALHKPHFKKTNTTMDVSGKVILHYISSVKPHNYLRSSRYYTSNMKLYWQYMKESFPQEKYTDLRRQAFLNNVKKLLGIGKK